MTKSESWEENLIDRKRLILPQKTSENVMRTEFSFNNNNKLKVTFWNKNVLTECLRSTQNEGGNVDNSSALISVKIQFREKGPFPIEGNIRKT